MNAAVCYFVLNILYKDYLSNQVSCFPMCGFWWHNIHLSTWQVLHWVKTLKITATGKRTNYGIERIKEMEGARKRKEGLMQVREGNHGCVDRKWVGVWVDSMHRLNGGCSNITWHGKLHSAVQCQTHTYMYAHTPFSHTHLPLSFNMCPEAHVALVISPRNPELHSRQNE